MVGQEQKEESKDSEKTSDSEAKKEGEGNKENSNSEDNEKFQMSSNTIIDNNKEINWKEIKNKVEVLYSSWSTIAADLKTIGVTDEQINDFNKALDLLTVSVKAENKQATLENILTLYSFLPKFENCNLKKEKRNILICKLNLLECYKNVDSEEWEQFNSSLTNLKMSYSNIMASKNDYKGIISNLENASVIINGMSNIIEIKDKDVFFIKYRDLMQEFYSGEKEQ